MERNVDRVHFAAQPTRSNHPSQPVRGNHQLVIVTQLLQIAGSMHHIDEMFLWLAHRIVQRLGVDVIQFWAQRPGRQGACELRSMVCRNIALPQHVVVNAQVIEIVERQLRERRGIMPQAAATIFPQQQTALLARFHLNYWACYFLHSSTLLPAFNSTTATDKQAAPLTMIVSLFLRQPPNPRLLPTLGHIMEQMVSIAKNRGLLLNETALSSPAQPHTLQTEETPEFLALIPQRATYSDALQAYNPFSSTTIITNKAARQLYLAIDGRRNLAELFANIQLPTYDFYTVLRLLLAKQVIQLYEPDGRPIDTLKAFTILPLPK